MPYRRSTLSVDAGLSVYEDESAMTMVGIRRYPGGDSSQPYVRKEGAGVLSRFTWLQYNTRGLGLSVAGQRPTQRLCFHSLPSAATTFESYP